MSDAPNPSAQALRERLSTMIATLRQAERTLLERAAAAAGEESWPEVAGLASAAELLDRARRIVEYQDWLARLRGGRPDGANDPLDPPSTIDPGDDPPSPQAWPPEIAELRYRLAEATVGLAALLPELGPVDVQRVARAITLVARVRRALAPPLPEREA